MTVKIKYGEHELEGDASRLPIQVEMNGIVSVQAMEFICNGQKYILKISRQGKLVVNK